MSADDLHDLVGAYAVGALDELEAQRFAHHLASCAACRDELASYSETIDALSEPGPGDPQPDLSGLADRIRAEVALTPQDAPPASTTTPAHEVPGHDSSGHESPAHARATRTPRLLVAAAAAVLIAIAGIGVALGLGPGDGTDLATDADRIQSAADSEQLALGLGDATVYVSSEEGGIAVVGAVPALTEGQTYQVWIVPADGSAPVPGPVMAPDTDGSLHGSWITSLDGAAAIALSVEPDGGSDVPTEVVAAVELQT